MLPQDNAQPAKPKSAATFIASVGALGSVVAASSCCIPLFPFLLAAGAAGTSAFIAQLRPYLMALSVLLIAYAFYTSWRARQCNRRPGKAATVLLWFSAAVVFVFLFFPQVIANLAANALAGRP